MQSAHMQGAPMPSKHKFQAGGGSWSRVNSRARSSDSDTEREYRSTSRSDPSSASRTRNSGDSDDQSPQRISPSATSPDPAPPIPYWSAKRHLTCGNPTADPPWSAKAPAWRGSAPGKLKTANAALVVCLNIDVDPPDVVKTSPCAVLECWVDPRTMPSSKALEAIGSNLRCQFEGLSLKIPYKPVLDPCLEDLRKCCQQLRKQANHDAVLFYYNGHGVPKPTPSGELWCFNRDYTQYIPVSLQEVQGWIGAPGVFIWDSSGAGHLLNNFNSFAEKRDRELGVQGGYREGSQQPMMNSLQLAACAANETLPTCPELPADLFTSCLTSPIDIALRHFIINHHLPNIITTDMLTQLPGDLKDRRTPLGELNWIFTAITDTIAWTTFSPETFTRLYRCDLLIASLFRNFLLAERIMKDYHCTPHTYPPLPATNTHPLWATWDLAVDSCLRQLGNLLDKKTGPAGTSPNMGSGPGRIDANHLGSSISSPPNDKPYVYSPSRFFAEQLTAFEVWISRGGSALTRRGPLSLPRHVLERGLDQPEGVVNELDSSSERHLVPRKPPDQLPIVLQVLLSQPHRLRALILLSQFVDLGPWAVHLVLTIGIFPYISKLLQAAGQDLRPVLIFIWARILAVDSSVQKDLYNTQGYKYFSNILGLQNEETLPNSSEHKAMCSFILSSISRDYPMGQTACWSERVFDHCYDRLEEPDYLLRQWTALCIAQMWDSNNDIKVYGVDRGTQDKLISMLSDDSAEVRSAALYALGTFMGASGSADPEKHGGGGTGTMFQLEERVHFRMEVAVATGATLAIRDDASPMCRKELLVVISCLVKEWRGYFVVCAWIYWEEDRRWRSGTSGLHHGMPSSYFHEEDLTTQAVGEWLDSFGEDEPLREENRVLLSSFFTIFVVLLDLSVDPYQEVATNAQTIVDYVMAVLLESPFSRLDSASLHIPPTMPHEKQGSPHSSGSRTRVASLQSSPQFTHYVPASPGGDRPQISRSNTVNSTISAGVAHTLKRTSSFANALKALTGSIAFPSAEDGRASPSLASAFLPSQSRSDRLESKVDASRPPSPNMNVAQYTSPYSRPPSIKESKSEYHVPPSPRSAQSSMHSRAADFSPVDVMEALFEEDMERLRARRKLNRNRHSSGGSLPSPSNSTFSMDSGSSVILGLGTGSGIRDVLPLKSSYYDWCAEYFKEPQMRQAEPDEPGSVQYNYQVWRQSRNEQVINETSTQAPEGATRPWDLAVSTFSIPGNPLTMAFHSFDQHLVIANEHDMISVWDWHKRKRLNYFCNGNPKGTSITSIEIINEDVGGIIVTGSADGIVRLYRNYDPTVEQGPLQMVSAFRALNEMILLCQGSGLVMDWKQSAGILLVGGDSHVIKVWDAQTETQGLDIDTNSKSPVTSIRSSVNGASQTFVCSFGDGSVKVFDRRMDDDETIVRSYNEHTSWVQKACWDPRLDGQIVSASLDGEVKLFDIRGTDAAVETWTPHPGGLSAFDMHPQAGVWATASAITPVAWRTQRVAVQGFKDPSTNYASILSTLNVNTGLSSFPMRPLPSSFIPRTSSLVFHPMEMVYGLGLPDGSVRIMGCKLNEPLDKL